MTSIFEDRVFWDARQHKAAAAVLGYEVKSLMDLVRLSPDHAAALNDEAERIAHRLAVEAAHYAWVALELEIASHAV